jgi:2-hydroxychromene-2-carboxylate isomerase
MPDAHARFFFDFVDPLSWLVELALIDLEAGGHRDVRRVGLELRPPPSPLTRGSDGLWADRWEALRTASPDVGLQPPPLVPWTRKAHELHAFASSRDVGAVVRRRTFEAYFERGRDIGRIDELVEIGTAAGLDRTETKAALDVDSHLEDVLEARRSAERLGILDLPALLVGQKLVQGFHNLGDLSTLLGGPPPGGR